MNADQNRKPGRYLLTLAGKAAYEKKNAENRARVDSLYTSLQQVRGGPSGMYSARQELERQLGVARKIHATTQDVLDNHQLVPLASTAAVVAIGTIISRQRYDENGESVGNPETLCVGGYGSSDPKTSPPTVSYDTLSVACLMGMPVGESNTVTIKKVMSEYEILAIRLPGPTPRLVKVA